MTDGLLLSHRVFGAIVLALVSTSCQGATGSFTVSLSREDLQEQIDQRFPVSRRAGLIDVTFSDPRVNLVTGSDRIGLALKLASRLPFVGSLDGHLEVSGLIAYNQETRQVFFHEPRIDLIEIDGVDPKTVGATQNAVQAVARAVLSGVPVYTLEQRTLKEAAMQYLLKSVRVRDGTLILEMALR